MDTYRDVDELYTMSLEKIIMDNGLILPSIWGADLNSKYKKLHPKRLSDYRESTCKNSKG